MKDFFVGLGVGAAGMAILSYFYAVKAIADIKKAVGAVKKVI